MTGADFVNRVQVKLNRIDTHSYQDIFPEEVLFFGDNALKALILSFDLGIYSNILDPDAIKTYLGKVTKRRPEINLTNNEVAYPADVLKIKDLSVWVTKGSESGWMPTRFLDNNRTYEREDNVFTQSFPHNPVFRIIDDKIVFDVDGFSCTKIKFDYLEMPAPLTEVSQINYFFNNELEDKTTTLILENLEARRLQTQPIVSKS